MCTKQICPDCYLEWVLDNSNKIELELAVRELKERNGKIYMFHTAVSLHVYVTSLKKLRYHGWQQHKTYKHL